MTYLAVIDVETTGINPYHNDRVIELAALIMRPDGEIIREFVTLINPERDIGPTSVHGLTAADTVAAPRFSEIAGLFLDVLSGCVAVAGHNIRFDQSFLSAEFDRLGLRFPDGPTICTMNLAGGGSLSACCDDYGIPFEGDKHTALYDARATAKLLALLLQDAPIEASRIMKLSSLEWPRIPKQPMPLLTRDESRKHQVEPPSYLQKLFARAETSLVPETDDSVTLAYTALLDRALEDRRIDDSDATSLLDLATKWGLTGSHVREIHENYLLQLAGVALADGVVTTSERRDILKVATLLGLSSNDLDALIDKASRTLSQESAQPAPTHESRSREQLSGMRVCFTGECQCRHLGETITRKVATDLATNHGIIVVESVTKKLDLLVVADPLSQSGKAMKARKYGIRIMHEVVFWKTLGIDFD